jgi:hypothetical protein
VEEIINGFPTHVLPKVDHGPTFEEIHIKTHLINVNLMSAPFMSGGGDHGRICVNMTPVEYAVISATPWSEPHFLSHIHIIVHGTYHEDAAQLARLHNEFKYIHTNRVNVDQALNNIILEAFDNMCTSQLEDYRL